jgi:uncharacterized protein (DUF302 family)
MTLGLTKTLELDYETTLAKLPEALKSEGFGGSRTVVTAIDPMETFAADDPALRPIADQVRAKLSRVLERLG